MKSFSEHKELDQLIDALGKAREVARGEPAGG